MRVELTGHAKAKCREFGITYPEAVEYVLKAREATIDELAEIYYAKKTHCEVKKKYQHSKHLIHLKYCFVVYDRQGVRVVATMYNPEYLFRKVQEPKEFLNDNKMRKLEKRGAAEQLKKAQDKAIKEIKNQCKRSLCTEHFGSRLYLLYHQGKKITYKGKPCQIVIWEGNVVTKLDKESMAVAFVEGVFMQLGPKKRTLITQCDPYQFEVQDDDSRNSELSDAMLSFAEGQST